VATLSDSGVQAASVAFRSKGNVMATGNVDGSVALWDMTNPAKPDRVAILTGHADSVVSVAFNSAGSMLAAGDGRGMTTLWDVADIYAPLRLDSMAGRGSVDMLVFSPDGRRIATTSQRTTTIWRVNIQRVCGDGMRDCRV
jgi:WD40 repeat protein